MIGESIFQQPGLERLTLPPVVGKFFSEIAPALLIPRTSRELLDAFAGIDVKADRVAELIRANPALEYLFMRNVQAIQAQLNREPLLNLETAVVQFGMQNTRNWIVGLQLHRHIRGSHPAKPSEYVKFASRAEDRLSGQRNGYADLGYLAGLHFDLLALVASTRLDPAGLKLIQSYLEDLYGEGLRRAQLAARLAPQIRKFSATKYVFAACLISDLGKAVLAIVERDYLKFVEAAEKAPRAVRMQAELDRFGTTHAVLSSWVVALAGALKPIAPALEFHHDPALVENELAALVSLVSQSAEPPDDFEGLRLKPDQFAAAVKA